MVVSDQGGLHCTTWRPGVTFIFFLQDYLREQPDNIKSVNLVAETTRFLNILYGNVNNKSAPLIIQLFDTLVEFTSVSTSVSCVESSVTVSQAHSFSCLTHWLSLPQ